MKQDLIASGNHIVALFYPVADAFAGGIDTDVICLRDYEKVTFVIDTGAIEDAGISNLITVNACTDAAKTGATAMAFRSRASLSSTTVDTWTALTDRTSAGYNFAAAHPAANVKWLIEVGADDVSAALANADFVYLTIAETANKTITASGNAILSGARYPKSTPETAIA